jgi:hypothetical protein
VIRPTASRPFNLVDGFVAFLREQLAELAADMKPGEDAQL